MMARAHALRFLSCLNLWRLRVVGVDEVAARGRAGVVGAEAITTNGMHFHPHCPPGRTPVAASRLATTTSHLDESHLRLTYLY